ncbi:patatin-like phospholipase family protein [Lacinutrix sp. MedPE-SW]|uniref:patatin-like phospholipase family protein n=1 Tax=Lacinutrix sp. MedPE-SW TaxID=1860087 RepID=UPI0009223B6A|nr:patatin-like phospholipase family protein [Lacinutrix sp. MedPE-SW]OIQ18760.1 MAG: patatin [Lacinutrix sp. MedPE-SW]
MSIGLVLSGGGSRGIAHIGVLRALEEYNIKISHISGTSCGAIVGSLYAAGHSWEDIFHFFKSVPLFSYKKYAINKPGFIDTSKFYKELLPYFSHDNFNALQLKLFITATNLVTAKAETFSSGALINTILASSAVPGIFSPVIIDNNPYTDGGILNNFPVEPILNSCSKIIGVYVNPIEDIDAKQLKHSYQVLNRAYQIGFLNQSVSKFDACDFVIYPKKLNKYGLFNLKNMETILKIGYEEAIKIIEENKSTFLAK